MTCFPRLTAVAACAAASLFAACGDPEPSLEELCRSRLPGDLVISEFMPDPEGTDTGKEYIELYNATGAQLDLKGLTLYVAKVDGSDEKKHSLRAVTIPAGGYLALGDAREDPIPGWMGYSYKDALGALPNTGGTIGIRCGTKLLDEVRYTTAGAAGRSRELSGNFVPDSAVNDSETNFCDASTTFDGTSFGTPGAPNSKCSGGVTGTCIDIVSGEPRAIVTPEPGDLVISELMPDPSAVADDQGEWFEVFAKSDFDLNGLTVTAGSSKSTVESESCLSVGFGSYAVLARNDDSATNGGLPAVSAKFTGALANSNGTLSVSSGDVVIDQVTWGSTQGGVALQLSPNALDAQANDVIENFCPAEKVYGTGTDKGTPGAENSACPIVVPAGQCFDADAMMLRAIVKPQVGELVISEFMPNPAAVEDTAGEWFELTALADVDLNELTVGSASSSTPITGSECLRLPAGAQAIFARSADPLVNGGLPFVTATVGFALVNSNGQISVSDGTTVIDTLSYASSQSGVATQVDPTKLDAVSNDDALNHCPATQPYGGGDLGTPGAVNTVCGATTPAQCMDATSGLMRDVVPPQAGQLVITEFMANPNAVGDTLGEYFELYATATFDLNGLQLGNEGTGNTPVTAANCLTVNAGDYAVFARNADPALNGGIADVTGTFSFSLANSGTTAAPRAIVLRSNGTEIDKITYTASGDGISTQLNPATLDAVANDDVANFCQPPAGTTYGAGDRGTPKLANVACP